MCVPTANVEVANVAMPAVEIVTGFPIAVAPSKNCTVPVGVVPVTVVGTVAVKVTDAPAAEGFKDELNVGVAVAVVTPSITAAEVAAA
jgi:hypothetical protein